MCQNKLCMSMVGTKPLRAACPKPSCCDTVEAYRQIIHQFLLFSLSDREALKLSPLMLYFFLSFWRCFNRNVNPTPPPPPSHDLHVFFCM